MIYSRRREWLLHLGNEKGWRCHQNVPDTKCCPGCETTVTFIHFSWEWKMVQTLWKTVWWLFIKLTVLIPYEPAITSLGIYPGKLKTFCLHKNLQEDVHSSFIHKSHSLEATYFFWSKFFSRQMDKQVVYPENEILISTKKKWIINHEKTMTNLKRILQSEKSQYTKANYCMILKNTTFWKKAKLQKQ